MKGRGTQEAVPKWGLEGHRDVLRSCRNFPYFTHAHPPPPPPPPSGTVPAAPSPPPPSLSRRPRSSPLAAERRGHEHTRKDASAWTHDARRAREEGAEPGRSRVTVMGADGRSCTEGSPLSTGPDRTGSTHTRTPIFSESCLHARMNLTSPPPKKNTLTLHTLD